MENDLDKLARAAGDLATVAANRQELGVRAERLAERLARRRFMWANHPDRRPDVPPALANRRGAIANMLIDQAEGALAAPPARRRARG